MPGRGFPIESDLAGFHIDPYAHLLYPRPQFNVNQPTQEIIHRRPRRPQGGRDEISSLLQEIMTTPENSGFEALSDDDDDLVEIVSARPSRPASTVPTPLALPQPGGRPSSTGAIRRRQHASSVARPTQMPRQDNAVIDLTEEPDSPIEVRPSRTNATGEQPVRIPAVRTHRHPRRTNSQRMTPPRLSRSESIMLASQTSFIDLTGDDDNTTTTGAVNEAPRRSNRNHQRPVLPPHPDQVGHDHLVDFEFLNPRHAIRYGFASSFARGFGRTLADILSADFLHSQPPLGRSGSHHHHHHPHVHTHQRPPSPRREMVPLPPTRAGFTRSTRAEPAEEEEEERVVICPSCNEELAYDPAGGAMQTTPGGAKKRKRAAGDHHFWAVKKCGHVYCAECFENRRPTRNNPDGIGFAGPPGKLPHQAPSDLRCAVEGCESKVNNKTEWVGIFL